MTIAEPIPVRKQRPSVYEVWRDLQLCKVSNQRHPYRPDWVSNGRRPPLNNVVAPFSYAFHNPLCAIRPTLVPLAGHLPKPGLMQQSEKALHKPSRWTLSRSDPHVMTYRFLWLRSFHQPISIRLIVKPDWTGDLISTVGSAAGVHKPGALSRDVTTPAGKHGTFDQKCFLSITAPEDAGREVLIRGVPVASWDRTVGTRLSSPTPSASLQLGTQRQSTASPQGKPTQAATIPTPSSKLAPRMIRRGLVTAPIIAPASC